MGELDAYKSDLITRENTITQYESTLSTKDDEMQKYKLDISTQASKEATKYKNALKQERSNNMQKRKEYEQQIATLQSQLKPSPQTPTSPIINEPHAKPSFHKQHEVEI